MCNNIKEINYALGDILYSMLIVLMFVGYPIFSMLAAVFEQDTLTVLYRGLCILIGCFILVVPFSQLKGLATYSQTQLIVILLHIIYISWVLFYFASGYENNNLNISFYINNAILFSLFPVLFLTKNINSQFYPLLKKHLRVGILLFILLTYYAYYSGLSDEYRLSFEKINPISLSLHSAICIILSFWAFKRKAISYFTATTLLIIMLLSGSRGPLVSLLFVFFFFMFFRMTFVKKIYAIVLVIISMILVFSFYDKVIESVPILSRFNLMTDEGGMSVNIREEQYNSAFSIFASNPFLGGSLVEHFAYFYPHNIILEVLITGGLFLFVIYLFAFSSFIVEIINSMRNKIPVCFTLIFFLLFSAYMFTSSLAGIGLLYFTIVLISKMNLGSVNDKYNHN